jgi:hypothetical protein
VDRYTLPIGFVFDLLRQFEVGHVPCDTIHPSASRFTSNIFEIAQNDRCVVRFSLRDYGVADLVAEGVNLPSLRILHFSYDSEKFSFSKPFP